MSFATATAAAAVSTASTASTTTSTGSTTTNYNIGALTTTWTPPSDCFKPWLGCSDCGYAEILQTCYDQGNDLQNNPTCFPLITLTPSTASSGYYMDYLTYGYYSPGIACPSGFTAACAMQGGSNGVASAISGSQQYDFSFTPSFGETAVGCCPTGYGCAGGNSCTQVFAETTLELLVCTTGSDGPTTTTTFLLPETPVQTDYETFTTTAKSTATSTATSTYYYTETYSQLVMYAPIYQLMYQATDLPASTTTTTSSSSSSDSTYIPATSTSTSSSHKSNTGTIAAAVTVPVVVIALAVAGFGWWWWRRRRARQHVAYEPAQPHSPGPVGAVEMSEQTIPWEMPATDARIELPGGAGAAKPEGPPEGIVHEMDAGGHN